MRLLLLISAAAAAVSALALPAHAGGGGHILAARANVFDGSSYTKLMYEVHQQEPDLSFDDASDKVFTKDELSNLDQDDVKHVKRNWMKKHRKNFPSEESYDNRGGLAV